MSEQVTCGCESAWVEQWGKVSVWITLTAQIPFEEEGVVGYCDECGARLSFDSAGQPVAQAMVPRAALEDVLRHHLVWDDVEREGDGDFAVGLRRIIDQQLAETRETDRVQARLAAQGEEVGDDGDA